MLAPFAGSFERSRRPRRAPAAARAHFGRLLLAIAPLLAAGACASVGPRFSQEVAAGFAQQPMRKLETPALEVYYPAPYADAARRIAERLEYCSGLLRRATEAYGGKIVVLLTSADFNNAYVQPIAPGEEEHMVAPLHVSLELFDFFNLGDTAVRDITCHEVVHYIQFQQNRALWLAIDVLTGGILSPQSFMEDWFLEGIATYYEGRLGKPSGRLHSPVFRGSFFAGVASQGGELRGGDLSAFNRTQTPYGAQYLVGSFFVDFLARRYGEARLWRLIDVQSLSVAPPLFGTLRFGDVYGKTIGQLLDEWNDELRALPRRSRPPGQTVLDPEPTTFARIAAAPDGTLAEVAEGLDRPPQLKVRNPDGSLRFDVTLTPTVPPRRWIQAGPLYASGLDFSDDGRWLYLVSADIDATQSFVARLWRVDAANGKVVRTWDGFSGLGGCLEAGGRSYVLVELHGGSAELVRLDLESGRREPLARFDDGVSISAPACARDGRIAFVCDTPKGHDLALRDVDGAVRMLTDDGRFNYGPRWLDERTLVFLRDDGETGQAYAMDVPTGRLTRVSDVPYVLIDPVPMPAGRLAFVNRDGWSWTVDSVALPELAPAPPAAPQSPGESAPAAPSAPPSAPTPPSPGAGAAPTAQFSSDGGPAAPPGGSDREGPQAAPPSDLPRQLSGIAEPPAVRPLVIERDSPYSGFDHLFVPQLRLPILYAYSDAQHHPQIGAGFSLQGTDRLGFHNWAANLIYDTGIPTPSVSLGYGNYLLAPWFLAVTGTVARGANSVEREIDLTATRSFWTSPVRFGFRALQLDEPLTGLASGGSPRDRLIGPSLGASYFAAETTPYGGISRGLAFAADVSYFPSAFGSTLDLADLRGEVDGWVSPPLSNRHTLQGTLVGRWQPGGARRALLEVGGVSGAIPVLRRYSARAAAAESAPVSNASLAGLIGVPTPSFAEPLRGYEDVIFAASAVYVASASYTFPFIVDRGWTSFLYLFPSLLVRQIDLEAFGDAALLEAPTGSGGALQGALARAAGAAVHLRLGFGAVVPLSLFYQFAYRFDAGLPPLHFVGLSLQ